MGPEVSFKSVPMWGLYRWMDNSLHTKNSNLAFCVTRGRYFGSIRRYSHGCDFLFIGVFFRFLLFEACFCDGKKEGAFKRVLLAMLTEWQIL